VTGEIDFSKNKNTNNSMVHDSIYKNPSNLGKTL